MNRITVKILYLLLLLILYSCSEEDPVQDINNQFELEQDEINGSLLPWPLVDNPEYVSMDEMRNIDDDEIVIVYKGIDQVHVYPTGEMYPVEIVNDVIDDIPVAITYCPLTKSSLAWSRINRGDTLSFTPSGFLFHSNLMPYDFETESIWSQMRLEGVRGERSNQPLDLLPLIELRWGLVKKHFPEALLFSGRNNSAEQRISNSAVNQRLASIEGDRVFGIIRGRTIDIYPFESFDQQVSLASGNSSSDVVIIGSREHGFAVAYETDYFMTAVPDAFPVIMKDSRGTLWNIFGEAVEGPRKGERLTMPPSYIALFWAWEGVFEDKMVVVN